MAKGINKVILIGNLGVDPEVRYSPNGAAVANIRLATSDNWRDKQTGEMQERTEWHRVVFFGKTAEIAGEYLKKGSKVFIEGRLQTRKWQNKEGQDVYTTEIVANDMQMLDGRGMGSGGGDSDGDGGGFQQRGGGGGGGGGGRPQQSNQQSNQRPQPAPQSEPLGDFDDDIPF